MKPNFKEVERIINAALAEDVGKGDVTSELLIPADTTMKLAFVPREPIVMCGGEIVPIVFSALDASIKTRTLVADGTPTAAGIPIIEVSGPTRSILTGERVALNLLQRMSSIATLTARYVKEVAETGVVILDTRKTMPGLRTLDKYAVTQGGGRNYRLRLDDAILIKDNHIAECGSIAEALRRARAGNVNKLKIEIECDTLLQVEQAVEAGADSILLDNMDVPTLRKAVKIVNGRATLEASGNASLETVRAIAGTGIDFISVGRLTHSVQNVDIGLDVIA